jgi:uncharacterized protein YlxW (UPF0749 family)
MNPFISRFSSNNWVVPVTILSFVLGFMLMLAWITKDTRNSRFTRLPEDQRYRLTAGSMDLQIEFNRVSKEVLKLREEKTKLEKAISNQTGSAKVLGDSLQEAKMMAGLTEVEGPGITVTLRDSNRKLANDFTDNELNIHDGDVIRMTNELWNAGAEAISVNNHRIAPRTYIRCNGNIINVDGIPIASPISIKALGDPDTMIGALKLRNGVIDEIKSMDPNMVEITRFTRARLPAYTGSTAFRIGKVPEEKK